MILDKVFVVLCFVFLPQNVKSSSQQDSLKSIILPPCKACNVFVESLKSVKRNNSETLIQNVCRDIVRGQNQCLQLRDQLEEDIKENWNDNSVDFFVLLCIEKLNVCCPPDHFGPKCEKCQECYKNGKCKGAGTRKGNGKCSCNPGYTGENCRECAVSYYEAFRDDSKLLCSRCHDACGKDGCISAGSKGCKSCKIGWKTDLTHTCIDINECLSKKNICTSNQFCVNNEGSYKCLECDRSCLGCDGDGPDMCKTCAEGYTLNEGKCTDDSVEKREQYVNVTRFLTYLGLCIATCVIFQSSTTKAYIVGAAVATYIAASEYWLTSSSDGLKTQIDTKSLEDAIMKML